MGVLAICHSEQSEESAAAVRVDKLELRTSAADSSTKTSE